MLSTTLFTIILILSFLLIIFCVALAVFWLDGDKSEHPMAERFSLAKDNRLHRDRNASL